MAKTDSFSIKDIIQSDTALIRELTDSIRSELIKRDLNNEQIFDFLGIRSVSRAFAHSLICLIEEFQQQGSRIELINLTPEVSKLIELVRSSRSELQAHHRPDLFPKRVTFDQACEHFEDLT